jgi:hypothetical protein
LIAHANGDVQRFRDYLIGQDPLKIEHHGQYMYRSWRFRGSAVMVAISDMPDLPHYIGELRTAVYRGRAAPRDDQCFCQSETSRPSHRDLSQLTVSGIGSSMPSWTTKSFSGSRSNV